MTENNRRERLFKELDEALTLFHKKLHRQKQDEYKQMGWGRLMVNTLNVYGKLLETDEMEKRIEKLEAQIKEGVVIPGEKH